MTWQVKTRPEPENPTAAGKNESGIVVYLDDGRQKVEVSRILFVRRNAKNKSVGFKRQLLKELDKAYEAVEILNEAYEDGDAKDANKARLVEDGESRRQQLLERLAKEETPRV